MSAGYPNAVWYPASSNNYSGANRPYSNPINKIIIHVTQGSWSATVNWFENPNAQVSAHYVVRSSDGQVAQSVSEQNIAWHADNWTYNQISVGIEHEGYIDDSSWFTDAMYQSSARVSAYLCDKYSIPADRNHIIGHNEVPGSDHQDPGPYWDWNLYMRYVSGYDGPSTSGNGGYSQVVDNASSSRFYASGKWGYANWNPQHYYWNYRYTTPKKNSDAAYFKIRIPQTGNYAVYARWPANARYNPSVPYGIKTTSGLKWVNVNQTRNGGSWVLLGTFNLAAGDDNKVLISRWTSAKGYIIADAVKVVQR